MEPAELAGRLASAGPEERASLLAGHVAIVDLRLARTQGALRGDGEDFILVFRMFDPNRPVVIGAPSSDLVDARSIRSAAGQHEFPGARAVPPLAHSLIYHGLVALGRAPSVAPIPRSGGC